MIVYLHLRMKDKTPFYVGMGETPKRAYNTTPRNAEWKRIARMGYEVEIVATGLSREQAQDKEAKLIKKHGTLLKGGILTNINPGGAGLHPSQ